MTAKKLVVFPNDPIIEYYKKGEITDRYFNPGNYFDEVHIISFSEEEVKPELVHCVGGNARLNIYRFRKIKVSNLVGLIFDYIKIWYLVKSIMPHAIRAYNSNITGCIAVSISKILKINSVISLHINPDKDIRHHLLVERNLLKYLVWYFIGGVIEPYVIRNTSHVICVYKFLLNYAISKRGKKNGVSVIYNRINSKQFSVEKKVKDKGILTILVVGRLFKRKNPVNIVKAVKDLDVQLVIIGDGPYYDMLNNMALELGIKDKVKFIRSIPNSEIHNYYLDADIFASVNDYGGISKPVIEAMNASLPIVVQKPLWEKQPELINDCSLVVENSPIGFRDAFQELISNLELRRKMGKRSREIAMSISTNKIEMKEVAVYKKVIYN